MTSHFKPDDGTIFRARQLRHASTPAERKLWAALRGGQLGGYKFRRQQRLGPYFADFACMSSRLVVEVDGETHANAAGYDARRTAFLEREGYRVLRFTNEDVLGNVDGVKMAINAVLNPSPSHAALPHGPRPLPRGERE